MRVLGLAVLSVVLCAAAPALAAPSAKDKAAARALAVEGRKAMKDQRFAEAADAFGRADALDPSPALELELAPALAASGKLLAAVKLLRPLGADTSPAAKKTRDAAQRLLAELAPRLPTLRITVVGPDPSKASVTVDGETFAPETEIPLDPGEHLIGASADGFVAGKKPARVAEGVHDRLVIALVPLDVKPADSGAGSRAPGIVIGSVGGVLLLAGAVTGGLAFGATSTAKAECPKNRCPASAAGDVSHAQSLGNASTGLLVAGSIVTVTGVLLAIAAPFGKAPSKETGANVAPWVGPMSAGLAGTF